MTCSNSCPPGFYPPTSGSGYSCYPCNSWCLTCTGSTQNQCLTCNTGAYQLNSTACYAITTLQNSRYNPCPNGYYGLQITKVCVACPTGCAICTIQLIREMPNGAVFGTTYANYNQNSVNCTGYGDPLCGYTLRCYQCVATGYTLINGFCIANNKCFQYSKYNSTAGGSFSASNCYCFPGFTSVFPGYCSKCHINCQTCTSTASSGCSTCPAGASGASCSYNTTYHLLLSWGSTAPSVSSGPWSINVAGPYAQVDQQSCASTDYIFGYYGYYNE